MKTIRFIGFALLTVLMSVSLSACGGSDDDEIDNGESSTQKKTSSKHIVKMINDGNGYITEFIISYDSQGRVIKYVGTVSSAIKYNSYFEVAYQYGEQTIISKAVEEGTNSSGNSFTESVSHSYNLENGKIVKDVRKVTSYDGYPGKNTSTTTTLYSYDSNGYLSSTSTSEPSYDETNQYEWTNGNLTGIVWKIGWEDSFSSGRVDYSTYTDIPWNKGLFWRFIPRDMDSFLVPGGYWGNTPKNMPSQDLYYTYKYESSDGLVTKITYTDNETSEMYNNIIVWE